MGNNQSRKTPTRGTPAYDMFTGYGEQSCKFLDKWYKDGLFPKDGSFDMDRVLYLKEALLNVKNRQGEWRALECWYGEATERHHKSEVRRLTDSQEKLKSQLANTAAQLANTAAQLAGSKDAQRKLEDQLAISKDDQRKLEDQLAISMDAQRKLEDQLAYSKDDRKSLADQLAESKDARKELEVQLADIMAQFTDSNASQRKLANQLTRSKKAQRKLADQLDESKYARKELEVQKANIWAQFTNSRDAQCKLADQLARSKDAQEKLKAEMADLRSKYEACRPWNPKPSTQILPAPWQRVLEGENGPAVSCATWTPGELRDLRNLFPDIQNHPAEFKEALDFIFRSYNPRWGEVNWFLGIVIPQRSVREQLLASAQWPGMAPGSEVALMLAKQCLLGAVLGVRPKNVNWGQICQCKQNQDETPQDYGRRLKECFEKYSGIPQPAENAPDVMAYAFVQSLQPETLEWCKKLGVEWRATSFSDLWNIADFAGHLAMQEQKRWELGFEDPAYRIFYDSD